MAPLVLPAPTFSREPFFGMSDLTLSSSPEPASPMERSIRSVMAKYGAADVHDAALLPSYRSLRRRRPREEDQAVAVTHDENTYKIMLDVREFAEGTLSVRALGDNELVVEGVVEKKQESQQDNCKSMQSSSRNFQQRFMFPGLQVEGVSSSVSSDGVLTITAPRQVSDEKVVEFKMPVTGNSDQQRSIEIETSSDMTNKSSQQSSTSALTSQQISSTNQTEQKSANNLSSQSITTNASGEHIVPIQLEGDASSISVSNQQKSTQQQQQSTQQQTSQQNTQQQNVSTQVFKQADKQLSSQDSQACQNSVVNVPISTGTLGRASSLFGNIFGDSLVPIDSRGLFFQDSFFENSRRHFQEAVDRVKRRVQPDLATPDVFNWYSSLRDSDRLEDTRAGTITTEGSNYKIVLDVRDFEEGSVSVRASGESELLIEGKVDKRTEGTTIMRSFRRRFVMPGRVKCEAITSALSADGVLTITAPKDESNFQIIELKGDSANMSKSILNSSSVFGSDTPSCASPSVSIPQSSATSPIREMSGPFEPVFSRTPNNSEASIQTQNDLSSTCSSTETVSKTMENISNQSDLQSKFNECMIESNKIISSEKEHVVVPIQVEQQSSNSKEKIVNINYINKSQQEIESQDSSSTGNTFMPQSTPQYQLIGPVLDLTDSNMKETVKQRKSSTSISTGSQTRDIAISYDNPSAFAFPIVRRGPFYQDSFFNEVHQNFQSAVRQVLDRWVDAPTQLSRNTDISSFHNFDRFHNTLLNYRSILDRDIFDDFTCYKSLRSRNVKEENQASTVRENTEDYKIVLDVHGFSEKDMTIRATSHNELLVEGCVKQTEAGTASSHTFRKQFLLPGPVRMEAVYSALSADDVLTITVPKNTALRIMDRASTLN